MKSVFVGKTILIVDDDPISALLFQEMLEPTKANIIVTYNGCSALDTVKKNSIDLVLLDIKLPDCNGFDVLPKIRAMKPEIIIIAQTANAMVDDHTKCINAGFDDYISKPILSVELFTKLEKFLVSGV